jgi:hypothetical protein
MEGLLTSSMVTHAIIVTETFLWLRDCCLQRLLMNLSVVFWNLKRLVVFGALLIVINSCVLNFECNKVPSWIEPSSTLQYWQGKIKTRRKSCPSATLSTAHHTRTDLGTNPGLRGERRRLTAWAMARLNFFHTCYMPRLPHTHWHGHVRFQVLTAASMKFRFVFWDVLPCKMTVDRRFRGTCCLHHQGDEMNRRIQRRVAFP